MRHDASQEHHTPEAIADRLAQATKKSYLGDGVLGAIDGTITTFAIVAASSGAGLAPGVALVLGFSNVLADGFSMACGNYLAAKASQEVVEKARRIEEQHIDEVPEGEREEVRQLFAAKGFEGDLLDQVVGVITADRTRWVDTMLTEELGHTLEMPEPTRAAGVTFVSFLLAGLVPLLALMFATHMSFLVSAVAAGATFLVIGWIKSRVVGAPGLRGAVETLLIGGLAAALAFGVAAWTRGLAG